jgi:DNA-binding FrmR family transcriptional regulator
MGSGGNDVAATYCVLITLGRAREAGHGVWLTLSGCPISSHWTRALPDQCRRPRTPAILRLQVAAITRGAPEEPPHVEGKHLTYACLVPQGVLREEIDMDVDLSQLGDVVARLKRVQGQIGGVVRMIEQGEDCAAVVTQLAAASKALDRAGFKIISTGMQQCLTQDDTGERRVDVAQLEKLFMSLA